MHLDPVFFFFFFFFGIGFVPPAPIVDPQTLQQASQYQHTWNQNCYEQMNAFTHYLLTYLHVPRHRVLLIWLDGWGGSCAVVLRVLGLESGGGPEKMTRPARTDAALTRHRRIIVQGVSIVKNVLVWSSNPTNTQLGNCRTGSVAAPSTMVQICVRGAILSYPGLYEESCNSGHGSFLGVAGPATASQSEICLKDISTGWLTRVEQLGPEEIDATSSNSYLDQPNSTFVWDTSRHSQALI
ncbi:hypothetical protein DFH06DRAFT_1123748 [Mycena polygramma]|nr:hypothetical protein DFH06DRAFT_1123748 [Mycena polygramma]